MHLNDNPLYKHCTLCTLNYKVGDAVLCAILLIRIFEKSIMESKHYKINSMKCEHIYSILFGVYDNIKG